MKEQDAGLLKILGPLAGDALRLSGYDKGGVSVALNPTDSKIFEVRRTDKLALLYSTPATRACASVSNFFVAFQASCCFCGRSPCLLPGVLVRSSSKFAYEVRLFFLRYASRFVSVLQLLSLGSLCSAGNHAGAAVSTSGEGLPKPGVGDLRHPRTQLYRLPIPCVGSTCFDWMHCFGAVLRGLRFAMLGGMFEESGLFFA